MSSQIFRHLKLGIALAIPASNNGKYTWNNSAGQGLSMTRYMSCHSITESQFSPVIKKRELSSLDITEKENRIAGGITLLNSISPIWRCILHSYIQR